MYYYQLNFLCSVLSALAVLLEYFVFSSTTDLEFDLQCIAIPLLSVYDAMIV